MCLRCGSCYPVFLVCVYSTSNDRTENLQTEKPFFVATAATFRQTMGFMFTLDVFLSIYQDEG